MSIWPDVKIAPAPKPHLQRTQSGWWVCQPERGVRCSPAWWGCGGTVRAAWDDYQRNLRTRLIYRSALDYGEGL